MRLEVAYPTQVSTLGSPIGIKLYYHGEKVVRGKNPWSIHFEGNIISAHSVQLDVNSKLHPDGHVSCQGSLWLVGDGEYWVQREG